MDSHDVINMVRKNVANALTKVVVGFSNAKESGNGLKDNEGTTDQGKDNGGTVKNGRKEKRVLVGDVVGEKLDGGEAGIGV